MRASKYFTEKHKMDLTVPEFLAVGKIVREYLENHHSDNSSDHSVLLATIAFEMDDKLKNIFYKALEISSNASFTDALALSLKKIDNKIPFYFNSSDAVALSCMFKINMEEDLAGPLDAMVMKKISELELNKLDESESEFNDENTDI